MTNSHYYSNQISIMKSNYSFWRFLFMILPTILLFSCGGDEEKSNVSDGEVKVSNKKETEKSSIQRKNLQIVTVPNQSRTLQAPITGKVISKNKTRLFAEVQGKVIFLNAGFKEGSSFRKGELLVSIDSKEFALNLESQRSAFLNILTGVMPDLKADYSANYETWQNYVQNYEAGKPLAELPETKVDAEKYFLTSNQVYSTYYAIKAQEERLSKYRIYAPYSGMVAESMIDIGGLVSPGQPLGTINNSNEYELKAGVGTQTIASLKVGDRIEFSSNQMKGNWSGKVLRISNMIDVQTQNVPVYFSVTGKNLKEGMYLRGNFGSTNYEGISIVPLSTIDRENKVLVLRDSLIVKQAIEVVENLGDSALVRGLPAGSQLVVNKFETPVEGKKVR